jgi:signal peptidase I
MTLQIPLIDPDMLEDEEPSPPRKGRRGFSRILVDWIEPILIALALAVFIRAFVFQPFVIPSGSMEDTLLIGDRVIALKFLYGTKLRSSTHPILKIRDPKPGDIVIFRYPEDPSKDFIKRCIAVGGQTVEIRNKEVIVGGVVQPRPRHVKFIDSAILPDQFGPRDNFAPRAVPHGSIFVMGDNRDNSNDSRFWGFVPLENIKGRAVLIYWSWNPDTHLYQVLRKIRWERLFTLIR